MRTNGSCATARVWRPRFNRATGRVFDRDLPFFSQPRRARTESFHKPPNRPKRCSPMPRRPSALPAQAADHEHARSTLTIVRTSVETESTYWIDSTLILKGDRWQERPAWLVIRSRRHKHRGP